MERPDDLAAELHRAAVVDPDLLDAPTDALPRFEHRDVGAAESEVARGGKAGEAGAEHEHVGQAVNRASSSRAIVSRISRTASSRSTSAR